MAHAAGQAAKAYRALKLDEDKAWIESVVRCPSPNADARPPGAAIDLLVVHGISLPPGEFGTPYVEALFCNRLDPVANPYFPDISNLRVSAHVFIRRSGELIQFVPFHLRAWHAGESEFLGRKGCNDFSIGVELEGTDAIPYEDCQYERLIALAGILMCAWPAITPDRVVGHCHIAPERKSDPGPEFDWRRIRSALGGPKTLPGRGMT